MSCSDSGFTVTTLDLAPDMAGEVWLADPDPPGRGGIVYTSETHKKRTNVNIMSI